ncbi:hypothetical protein DUNSADRAFT_72 [Dunaliella salina]|uniref:Glycosyl transferase CAP10 domain-containing protein n=1 Tax=Dunaliella salina TaxID=3046 RepID=A0ABQ7H8U0_DUNSA|nr:hypothetical protein DUNSADRAFT_72 [Dunaliella salina]|eukprot:KAF5843270.1 hypothetical protein DUNSADRAFT_72 [Dunaliella salina]
MWLALEEAIEAGVQFPDVMFLYNGGDQPMCNKYYPCHDYLHVPPISVIGYNESLLPPNGRGAAMDFRPATGLGDLVTPLFRFTGHSMAPSLHPHHPTIVKLHSHGDPLWSSKRIITRNPVPWQDKVPKLFFRGKAWCSYMKRYGCPRTGLSNMTLDHWEELDVSSEGARLGRRVVRPRGYRPFYPMADWSKFKYLAALDGIGASSRTIVLYHLGSVVLKQRRTAYVEWFYQSLKTGVHQEEVWNTDTDALDVVRKLRANDDYARGLADASAAFARNYLVKEVMMVYTKVLLQRYRDLFEDMEEYMQAIGDPGNSSFFQAHLKGWSRDWRSLGPVPDFIPNFPKTGMFDGRLERVRGLHSGPALRGSRMRRGHIHAGN